MTFKVLNDIYVTPICPHEDRDTIRYRKEMMIVREITIKGITDGGIGIER
jgi:hypothetical protein